MRRLLSLAWWRHTWSHRRCEYVSWPAFDGWYCGACHRTWDTHGREDTR